MDSTRLDWSETKRGSSSNEGHTRSEPVGSLHALANNPILNMSKILNDSLELVELKE